MSFGFSFLAAATNPAGSQFLVPTSAAWVVTFLLMILWLFVAAILLGPLIRHFRLEPTSSQYFADDRSTPPRR
jgi:hypothetical protein